MRRRAHHSCGKWTLFPVTIHGIFNKAIRCIAAIHMAFKTSVVEAQCLILVQIRVNLAFAKLGADSYSRKASKLAPP